MRLAALAADLHDFGARSHARAEPLRDAPHIFARPAVDGAPAHRRVEPGVEVVIGEEAQEALGGEFGHPRRRRRPDRAAHRQDEAFAEILREAALGQPVAEAAARRAPFRQIGRRDLAEAQHLPHRHHIARIEDVAPLREDLVEVVAGVFQRAFAEAEAEGHVGPLRGHAERLEQRREVGVVARVVDDEAGVDGDPRAGVLDLDGVGVAADAPVLLEQGHVGDVGQRKGRPKTGRAGPDDCDLQTCSPPRLRGCTQGLVRVQRPLTTGFKVD